MVSINTGVPQNTEQAEEMAWGILEGRSMPALKFTQETPPGSENYVDLPIGTNYTGVVAENMRAVVATDFTTKAVKTYKDGTPIKELMLVLSCPNLIDPNDSDDDGLRQLRLAQMGKRALQDEMQAKGIKSFGVGTQVTIEFVGYKSNGQGKKASKTFAITLGQVHPYVPSSQQQVEQVLAQAQPVQQQAQPAQQAPVQQIQQPVQQMQQPVQQQAAPQPVQQQAPVQQAPVQQAAPQPAMVGIVVTQEHVNKVNLLMTNGIAREAAIQAVAMQEASGDAGFATALGDEIPF